MTRRAFGKIARCNNPNGWVLWAEKRGSVCDLKLDAAISRVTNHAYEGVRPVLTLTALLTRALSFAADAPANGNKATPPTLIKAAKGFQVELLYSVPAAKQGSWVAFCTDDQGRIYASDQ